MTDIFGKMLLEDGKLIGEAIGQPSLEPCSAVPDIFDPYFGEPNVKTQVVFVRDSSGKVAFIRIGFCAAVRQQ